MQPILRTTFARFCRETRLALDVSQQELASAVGVARGYISMIEHARANPSLALVERIGDALGIEFQLVGRAPTALDPVRQRDLVHARCSGYADRRLRQATLATAREVEVIHGRTHGWIDLLAFDPRSQTLFIVEIKTRIDDVGALERQVQWYERSALAIARRLGWQPRRLVTWVLALASDEVDAAIRINRDIIAAVFPVRAPDMLASLAGSDVMLGRGLALIDPTSRRRDWLIRTKADGRRTPAPFTDYADAARRFGEAREPECRLQRRSRDLRRQP